MKEEDVKARIIAPLAALALSGFAAGCGSSNGDDKAEKAERSTTPQQAVAQIAQVRSGLAEALATYRSGDASAADEQVGDTYLKHFELVEGPLDEVAHELNEELEDAIREELREQIRANAGAARVARLVRAIDAQLDEAKQALASS
jgi:hypothetical protein